MPNRTLRLCRQLRAEAGELMRLAALMSEDEIGIALQNLARDISTMTAELERANLVAAKDPMGEIGTASAAHSDP